MADEKAEETPKVVGRLELTLLEGEDQVRVEGQVPTQGVFLGMLEMAKMQHTLQRSMKAAKKIMDVQEGEKLREMIGDPRREH